MRRKKAKHRPDPPVRLQPCEPLFILDDCDPHDYQKKWSKIASEIGIPLPADLSTEIVLQLKSLLRSALDEFQEYLNLNHPRHADLKDQDAYALFFPVISEAVIAACLSGYHAGHKDLDAEMAMTHYRARQHGPDHA